MVVISDTSPISNLLRLSVKPIIEELQATARFRLNRALIEEMLILAGE